MKKNVFVDILTSLSLVLISGWALGFYVADKANLPPFDSQNPGEYLKVVDQIASATMFLLISWLWISLRMRTNDKIVHSLRKDAYGCSLLLLLLPAAWLGHQYGWSSQLKLLLAQTVLGCSIFIRLSSRLREDRFDTVSRKHLILVLSAAVLFAFFTSRFAFFRHNRFYTFSFDMGMVSNVVWNISRGHLFQTSLFPWSILGEHFAPVYLLYAPFYWLWSDPRMLIIVQSALLGLSAIPLFFLGNLLLRHRLASLFIVFSYLYFPGLRGVAFAEVHEVAFFPLFFFTALYCFYSNKPRWQFILFWILAIFCKEDTGLLMAAVGLLLFFHEKRPLGLILFLGSALWFYLSIKLFIPAFRGEGYSYTIRYAEMGGSFTNIFLTAVLNPVYTLKIVFNESHRMLLFQVFGGFLFLPLFSLPALLVALTPLASSLLASEQTQSWLLSQYPAVWLPAFVFAVLIAIRNISRWKWTKGHLKPLAFASAILVVAILLPPVSKVPPWRTVVLPRQWRKVYPAQSFGDDAHRVIHRFNEPDASVSAQTIFVPHLATRENIIQFPDWNAEYILVDISPESNKWPLNREGMLDLLLRLMNEQGYRVADFSGTVYLLQKDAPHTGATENLLKTIEER